MDKPYCTYADDDSLIPQKCEIQLEKEWDLYDLTQEFLSDAAKQFYTQPTQPRPTKKQDKIIESDDNNLSDPEEDNIQKMLLHYKSQRKQLKAQDKESKS